MIVICNQCETAFNIDESLIKDTGSRVRCSKCRHEFAIYPEPESTEEWTEAYPETEADGLGLLGTDPLPTDFSEEYVETGKENASTFAMDGTQSEADPDPAFEKDNFMPELADDPEEPSDFELPALEDLEAFDEKFIQEEDELAVDESFRLEPELNQESEKELLLSGDPDCDLSETDVLDLSDITELIESEDFTDAIGADVQTGGAGDGGILDINTLFGEATERTEASGDGIGIKPASTDSEAEMEISFGPEIMPAGKDNISNSASDDGNDPDIFSPETEPVDSNNHSSFAADDISSAADFSSTADDFPESELDKTTDLNEATELIDVIPVQTPPQVIRSRIRLPVIALISFLIAASGIVAASKIADIRVSYLDEVIKKIPIAGDLLAPETTDRAGNLNLTPLENTVSGKFVENTGAGRLFVIRGQVRNEYDKPRSFIRISAKLYQKGNKLVKIAEVYCGNVIDEQDLSGLEISAISRRMQNSFGDNHSNLRVKKGDVVPFMIVFDQLPDNLDEYSVEVAGSTG